MIPDLADPHRDEEEDHEEGCKSEEAEPDAERLTRARVERSLRVQNKGHHALIVAYAPERSSRCHYQGMTERGAVEFSPAAAQALRRAKQLMHQAEPGDLHSLYEACRGALTNVADVDACYVGHFRASNRLVIPYLYDRGKSGSPDVMTFGEFGLSHWLRTWRTTYTFAQDQGRLVHAGRAFADPLVRDAVVAPLLDSDGSTTGMLAALSYTSDHFTPEGVRVVQWLARQLNLAIRRGLEDRTDLNLLASGSDAALDHSADLVHAIAERFGHLQNQLEEITVTLGQAPPTDGLHLVTDRLVETGALCARYSTELALLVAEPGATATKQPDLTAREMAIASLIAREGLSNTAIATRLVISEKTVKTHVSHIFRKMGVTQRSELQYVASGWS